MHLYTVAEAADKLRISKSLIYAMVQEGKLPAVRFGRKGRRGCLRIREEDIERLTKTK